MWLGMVWRKGCAHRCLTSRRELPMPSPDAEAHSIDAYRAGTFTERPNAAWRNASVRWCGHPGGLRERPAPLKPPLTHSEWLKRANGERRSIAPQRITIRTGTNVGTVEAEIIDPDEDRRVNRLELKRRDDHGGRVFEGTIPPIHALNRHLIRFHLIGFDGALVRSLPTDGPITAVHDPVWGAMGQFFLYDPPETVSHPRIETHVFHPKHFAKRRVRVLLPRGYDENRNTHYPVLYAQDAQNVFSPGSPFGSWDLDLIMMNLVSRGEIPEVILVGIDNTDDRLVEYTPEYCQIEGKRGRGGEFLSMLRNELMPIINSRYRTLGTPESTGHIGSSLGGLLGYHAANEFRETFGVVAALSPSFWVNMEENLARAARGPETRGRLWLDCGATSNVRADGFSNLLKVRDALLKSGHETGPSFMYVVGIGHKHTESDWRERCPDILRWMYPPPSSAPPARPMAKRLQIAPESTSALSLPH